MVPVFEGPLYLETSDQIKLKSSKHHQGYPIKKYGGERAEIFSVAPRNLFQLVLIPTTTYFISSCDTHTCGDTLFCTPYEVL